MPGLPSHTAGLLSLVQSRCPRAILASSAQQPALPGQELPPTERQNPLGESPGAPEFPPSTFHQAPGPALARRLPTLGAASGLRRLGTQQLHRAVRTLGDLVHPRGRRRTWEPTGWCRVGWEAPGPLHLREQPLLSQGTRTAPWPYGAWPVLSRETVPWPSLPRGPRCHHGNSTTPRGAALPGRPRSRGPAGG